MDMTTFTIEKVAINAPPRKLKGNITWKFAPDRNPNDPYNQAVENFFHDWVTIKDVSRPEWGPEVWEPWGFTIKDSRVTITDEKKFTMFLLRWS